MRLGCDLEKVEKRSRSFEETFFNTAELAMLEQQKNGDRARLVTLIWSAKESALKALREGLRMDTRAVEVSLTGSLVGDEWTPLTVRHGAGESFRGLWRTHEEFVLTVVAEMEPEMIRCRHEWGPPL